MTKSHATLEQRQCAVCGEVYDTGAVLLDTKLRPKFTHHTLTGTGFCPEHQALKDSGYIAVIESDKQHNRTGRVAHLRASVWSNILEGPIPDGGIAYCPVEVMDILESLGGTSCESPSPSLN